MSIEKVKAVILVDEVDLGRCPVGDRLPRAMWPVGGMTVLERLIEKLANQGVRKFAVCEGGDKSSGGDEGRSRIVEKMRRGEIVIQYVKEGMPRGAGGRLFDAAGEEDELFLVLNCNIITPPVINEIIASHKASQADMTIGLGLEGQEGSLAGDSSQVYLFERSALKYIPDIGYCDIKEGLIPKLVAEGKKTHAFSLSNDLGSFKSWQEYLRAVLNEVEQRSALIHRDGQNIQDKGAAGVSKTPCVSTSDGLLDSRICDSSENLTLSGKAKSSVGGKAFIAESVRFFGPVVVCDGVNIEEDAIIIGPAIICTNVGIGRGATVAESVVWEGSRIGSSCVVQGCLVDCGVRVANNRTAKGELLTSKYGICGQLVDKGLMWLERLNASTKSSIETIVEYLPDRVKEVLLTKTIAMWIGAVIIFACFLISYWEPTIRDLWQIWMRSDEFSSGLLVPFLAGYVLWSQRHELSRCIIKPCMWGLAAFAAAQAMRFFGLWFMYGSAERLSLILTFIAVALLLLGWRIIWRIVPVILYLFFMLPLPSRVQLWITQPLQRWATTSAVFGLEMLGYDVVREGNVINLNGTLVAVAEACNGLRMLTAFFVISGLVALLVNRKWWEKIIIFASSIPIAFACNTLRLVITAIAFTKLNTEHWEKVFHDFGGLAMMPLALGIIVLELWLLSNLVSEQREEECGKALEEVGSGVVYRVRD